MSATLFRPKVEEVEPRLLPDGGIWHAYLHNFKAQARLARPDGAVLATLTDPFCAGQDPGPCAARNPVPLRADLDNFFTFLGIVEAQRYMDLLEAEAHYNEIRDHNASDEQLFAARLDIDYASGRETAVSLDIWGLTAYRDTPNDKLVGWAEGLVKAWNGKAKSFAESEKQAERDVRQDIAGNRLGAVPDHIRQLATAHGWFDQEVEDILNFTHFVTER